MSDTMDSAVEAAPEAEAPVIDRTSDDWDGTGQDEPDTTEPETEEAEESEATEEEIAAETETEEPEEGKPLTLGQAKKLRDEAHGLRERAREYETAFEGIHPEDKAFVLEATALLKTDPAAFVQRMAPLVKAIEAQQGGPQDEAEEGTESEDDVPMTKAEARREFERLAAERDQKAEIERRERETKEQTLKEIREELSTLGYKVGAEKGSPEARRLVTVQALALNEFDGDLKAAHDWLEQERKGAVRAVSDKKAAQRNGSAPVARGQAGTQTKAKPPMYLPGSTRINPEWEAAFDAG